MGTCSGKAFQSESKWFGDRANPTAGVFLFSSSNQYYRVFLCCKFRNSGGYDFGNDDVVDLYIGPNVCSCV